MESGAQAKTLGRDVILYAVRKHRGWVTKLGREGVLPWCKREGKGRGKKHLSFGVHRVIRTYTQIS